MATKLPLSPLKMIDLRDCWDHEALDFTPWLASNLGLLGDAIGMELELVGTEQSVGTFSADILCRSTGTGEWVLIENQLEGTDHSHLGQLLTYTAGLHATTIVWVTRRFREEHRAALDWLNEHTIPEIRFFGLEMQLWRIGDDGPVAPKFNIVCQPNNYSKALTAQKEGGSASGGNGGTSAVSASFRLRYWTAMVEQLKNGPATPLKPQAPRDQGWYSFSIGRTGFLIDPYIIPRQNLIRTELYLYGVNAKTHFQKLLAQKEEIEQELGPLQWEELPTKQDSRIAVYREGMNPIDESTWPEQHQWLLEKSLAFYNTFRPRILALKLQNEAMGAESSAINDEAGDESI